MNLRLKKLLIALFLIIVFGASFLIVFYVTLAQYGYSEPSLGSGLGLDNVHTGISCGPGPNATNVPLDTTIVINMMRPLSVEQWRLTPQVLVAHRIDSHDRSGRGGSYTLYPAEPLKPATTYNVSVLIMDEPAFWSFTTTSEPLSPQLQTGFYLASNAFWIALAAATAGTSIVGAGLLIYFKRYKR